MFKRFLDYIHRLPKRILKDYVTIFPITPKKTIEDYVLT